LAEKLNVFIDEYDFQSDNEFKTLMEEKEEINRLKDAIANDNREYDEI